ncbi:MAG: glycerol-3-phosphate 1-O-acyltransferase PlsY [Holosporales bacterium]|nr:glycerol-3-phosphate 1-O-acyltransferase PlsY [Holosporales bacterium]
MVYVFILLGYLCGSIPFGVLFSRIFRIVDIRNIGSGNIGATNVFRTGNYKAAVLTLVFDFLKGFIPVSLYIHAYRFDFAISLVALSVVIGHVFSIFLKFKGGKGVATTAGAYCALDGVCFLIGLISWCVVFFSSKISSLAALISLCVILPLFVAIMAIHNSNIANILLFAIVNSIMITFTHISNIKRLLEKKELKLTKNNK